MEVDGRCKNLSLLSTPERTSIVSFCGWSRKLQGEELVRWVYMSGTDDFLWVMYVRICKGSECCVLMRDIFEMPDRSWQSGVFGTKSRSFSKSVTGVHFMEEEVDRSCPSSPTCTLAFIYICMWNVFRGFITMHEYWRFLPTLLYWLSNIVAKLLLPVYITNCVDNPKSLPSPPPPVYRYTRMRLFLIVDFAVLRFVRSSRFASFAECCIRSFSLVESW